MAITYQTSGSTPVETATSSWSFTPDAGTLAGDVFVVQVFTQDTNANITPPAGSTTTAVNNHDGGYAPGGNRVSVFAWVAPSNAPGAQTVGVSAAAAGTVTWARFRGVDTSSPFDAFQYASNAGGSAVSGFSTPAVTTTVADCYILAGLCIDAGSSAATLSGPSGSWTNLFPTISPRKGAMALKGVQPSAGSSGAVTGWGSSAGGTADAPRVGWQAALRPGAGGPATPELAYAIIGAATSDGFTVHAKVSNTDTARLKVASNSGLSSNVAFSSSASPDSDGFVSMTISGLPARPRDYYAVELTNSGGVVTTSLLGSPKRAPAANTEGSFTVAMGSCWNPAITGTPAFSRILAQDPTVFLHLGDWNYTNSESTSQASHRADMEAQITADSGLRSLLASVPTTYVKSDHDGDANEKGPGVWTAPNRAATLQMFPYPPRPNSDGLYHSFVIGRARFICIDTRYLGNNSTTLLGATQLAWLKAEFEQPEPLKFFVMDGPWISDEPAGDPATDDSWPTFAAERQAIADHWTAHGVGQLIALHGDQHAISADNGANNPWGGFPSFCAAPLRNTSSIKTTSNSKWSQGIYPTTEGVNVAQYGVVTVTDTGDTLTVLMQGYDTSNVVRVSMTVNVPLEEPAPTITTAELTDPTGRWQGKATRLSWWDGTRWGAVLPTDQGHVIYPDLGDLDTFGPVVDSRQGTRASVVFHDGTLMVLRGHSSASRFSSYDATDGYSPIVADASVPLTSANLDASPVTLHRSANGSLWAACMTGGAVRVTRSTDSGATWGTAQTVTTIGSVSGIVGLVSTGSTVVLVATANDGAGRAVRSIPQGSASYASASWATETLPALPAGVTSDDHLDVGTLPDGRVLAVAKATNATNTWLLYSMLRATDGTWTQAAITTGEDAAVGDTRPALAVEPGAARVIYGRLQSTPPANLLTRVGMPGAWSSQSTLLAGGDRSDSGVPPAGEHIAAATGDYPILVHDRADASVDVVWVTPAPAASEGAAAGSTSWTGAATGQRAPRATAGGDTAWAGAAAGARTPVGVAAPGGVSWQGAAAGQRTPIATAAGSTTWAGAAVGQAPQVGQASGTATGSTAWAGTATGKRTGVAVANGTTTWAGAAVGTTTRRGTATGAMTWAGTATGTAPTVDGRYGTATGATTWAGAAAGERHPHGTATGTTTWTGTATATLDRAGTATGTTTWTGTATGKAAGPSDARDITITLGPPVGHPLTLEHPTGRPFAIGTPRR